MRRLSVKRNNMLKCDKKRERRRRGKEVRERERERVVSCHFAAQEHVTDKAFVVVFSSFMTLVVV